MPLKDHTGRMNPIEKLLRVSRIGMITNQSAFGSDGEYHFQSIHKLYDLKKIFLPEHGLFAELQDQVSGSSLRYDLDEVEFVNLYGDQESSLAPDSVSLDGLDVVIIDIRDTGARYYTFLTTAYYFLEEIHKWNSSGKTKFPRSFSIRLIRREKKRKVLLCRKNSNPLWESEAFYIVTV